MTVAQEHLREAFESALKYLRGGQTIARVETKYRATVDSAVVLVIGEGCTFELVGVVDKLMTKWDKG